MTEGTALTRDAPVRGAEYDPARPETKQAWLDQRRGGLTATEVRDWGQGSKRRAFLTEKVTGDHGDDIGNVAAVRHGHLREPQIAAWIESQWDITPCNAVYSAASNPRFLASPDGISLDPFSRELIVGSEDAALAEIKTATTDLTPGPIDAAGVLVAVTPGTPFDKENYYAQVQWQMLVMNATRTLFVWERHTGEIDPETGTYTPDGPPSWCWIMRDQEYIDALVEHVALPALAEIDAARLSAAVGDLPPVSDLPAEHALLVAEYLRALDAEKVAAAAKVKAWEAIQAIYLAEGAPDTSIDAGFARLTVSTSGGGLKKVVDIDRARAKAPALVARYEALIERFTRSEPTPGRRTLTITRPKGNVGGAR